MIKLNFKAAAVSASILAITVATGGLVLSQNTTPTGHVKGTSTNAPSVQKQSPSTATSAPASVATQPAGEDAASPATNNVPADQRVAAKKPAVNTAVAIPAPAATSPAPQTPVAPTPAVPTPVETTPAKPTFHLAPRVNDAAYYEYSYNFGGQQYTFLSLSVPVDITYDAGFDFMTMTSFDCDFFLVPTEGHDLTCGAGQKEAGVILVGINYTDASPLGLYGAELTVRIGDEVKAVQVVFELAPETEAPVEA